MPCRGQVVGCSGMNISLSYTGLSLRDHLRGPCRSGKRLRGLLGIGTLTRFRGSFRSLLPPGFAHIHSLAAACHASLFSDSQQIINVKILSHEHSVVVTIESLLWGENSVTLLTNLYLFNKNRQIGYFFKKLEVGSLCANRPKAISICRNQQALAGKDQISGREGGDREAPAAPLSSFMCRDRGGSSSSKASAQCVSTSSPGRSWAALQHEVAFPRGSMVTSQPRLAESSGLQREGYSSQHSENGSFRRTKPTQEVCDTILRAARLLLLLISS